ncbi:MAG TPA: nucleoside deaminase [Chitinophagaceae bacterium]|nr:nucleoside deaminase [Chitinophagaceae bacterium]
MNNRHQKYMQRAIGVARQGMNDDKGGPFGAIVVKNDEIIAEACNRVSSSNDPTAHAEIEVIRKACYKLGTFQLADCIIYTSCEPCPMCFGAIYWARPKAVYYGCTKEDAARIDFDDHFIYDELEKTQENQEIPFEKMMQSEANEVFKEWKQKGNKILY